MTDLIKPHGYTMHGLASQAYHSQDSAIFWGSWGNNPQGRWCYYVVQQTANGSEVVYESPSDPGVQGMLCLGIDGLSVVIALQGRRFIEPIPSFVGNAHTPSQPVSTTIDQTARDMAANAAKSSLEAAQIANGVRSIAQRADERAVAALSQANRLIGMVEGVADQVRRLLGIVEKMPQFIADTAWAKANDAIVARFNAWASYQDKTLLNLFYNRWRKHAKAHGLIGEYQDVRPDRYE